ncbi:hypothetical protein WA026_000416 [Henosepilachna vigintioctopunctata]|uniref:Uncharacterized protein n=1 Tax=Henosepilachna vigintioctopunctata TaxID=420089 RepID=A0AAW1UXK0_9CUCU
MKIFNSLLIYVFVCSIISVFCDQSYDAPLPLQAKYQLNKRQGAELPASAEYRQHGKRGSNIVHDEKLPLSLEYDSQGTDINGLGLITILNSILSFAKPIVFFLMNNPLTQTVKKIIKNILSLFEIRLNF